MSYKRILVAVDLSESSKVVISKAVSLAKDTNAELYFIYVDDTYATNYLALSNSDLAKIVPVDEKHGQLHKALQALADQTDYPIQKSLVVMGDLNHKLNTIVEEQKIDLLICGHHQDFWGRLLSSVRRLVNTSVVDLLIIQL